MNEQKRCPVCKTVIQSDANTCSVCGMSGLNQIFFDKKEYDLWVETQLNPYISSYHKAVEEKEDNYVDEGYNPSYDNYIGRPCFYLDGHSYAGNVDDNIRRKIFALTNEQKRLTILAEKAEAQHNYTKAAELWNKIAPICRRLGWKRDAYLVEHAAFLCTQKEIYREAKISFDEFCGKIPFVENLKVVMTKEAEQAWKKEEIDKYVMLKLVNARICRAQGKKEDACLLENSANPYRGTVENALGEKKISWAEFEKQCLKDLAIEYEAYLYQ